MKFKKDLQWHSNPSYYEYTCTPLSKLPSCAPAIKYINVNRYTKFKTEKNKQKET